MLARRSRLRSSREFARVVADGRRCGRRHLVVHLLVPAGPAQGSPTSTAGFVVSAAVGGSVTRHAVTRRLRPLVATRLGALPDGSRIVVRALPAAARASSAALAADLDSALARLGVRSADEVPA